MSINYVGAELKVSYIASPGWGVACEGSVAEPNSD